MRHAVGAKRRHRRSLPLFWRVADGIANHVPLHANCWASVLSAALVAWPQLWREPNTREVNKLHGFGHVKGFGVLKFYFVLHSPLPRHVLHQQQLHGYLSEEFSSVCVQKYHVRKIQ